MASVPSSNHIHSPIPEASPHPEPEASLLSSPKNSLGKYFEDIVGGGMKCGILHMNLLRLLADGGVNSENGGVNLEELIEDAISRHPGMNAPAFAA